MPGFRVETEGECMRDVKNFRFETQAVEGKVYVSVDDLIIALAWRGDHYLVDQLIKIRDRG